MKKFLFILVLSLSVGCGSVSHLKSPGNTGDGAGPLSIDGTSGNFTPPIQIPVPVAGLIKVIYSDSLQQATVIGSAGAVQSAATVKVVNRVTFAQVSEKAKVDGSFEARIAALRGHGLVISQVVGGIESPGLFAYAPTENSSGAIIKRDGLAADLVALPSPLTVHIPDLLPTQRIRIGQSLFFSAQGSGGKGKLNYQWDFGGAVASQSKANPGKVFFYKVGTYPIKVTVTDKNGDTATSEVEVVVLEKDIPMTVTIDSPAEGDSVLIGNSFSFSATAQGGNGSLSYQWDFGDGAPASAVEDPGEIILGHSGTYEVKLTVTDSEGDQVVVARTLRVIGARQQSLSVGYWHACVVLEDSTVRCWGNGMLGELGDNTVETDSQAHLVGVPTAVVDPDDVTKSLTDVESVAAGRVSTCALMKNHTVKCWGGGRFGGLGDGNVSNHNSGIPVPVLDSETGGLLSGVVELDIGQWNGCARLESGRVKCWGQAQGQVGSNVAMAEEVLLEDGSALSNVREIAAGDIHFCGLLMDDTVQCWGGMPIINNPSGPRSPLDPDIVLSSNPELHDVISIGSASVNNCAVLRDGTVKCWGNGEYGVLGDNIFSDHFSEEPQFVLDPFNPSVPFSNVAQVALDYENSCSLMQSSDVFCWGRERHSGLPSQIYEEATGLPLKAHEISTGVLSACALLDSGHVACWGSNTDGELGTGEIWGQGSDKAVQVRFEQ